MRDKELTKPYKKVLYIYLNFIGVFFYFFIPLFLIITGIFLTIGNKDWVSLMVKDPYTNSEKS